MVILSVVITVVSRGVVSFVVGRSVVICVVSCRVVSIGVV